ETEHEPWQLLNQRSRTSISAKSQASGFKPITFEAKPDPELIIKSPWDSLYPICDGKHGNYELHGEWYRNGTEYCLTCNSSSNKLEFAIVA
ncbi:13645_t:CDS:2, partial [Ambispora gerdemannii]